MKIKSKFFLNAIISILLIILIMIIIAINNYYIQEEINKSGTASILAKQIINLLNLTNEFQTHHYDREEDQWDVQFNNIILLIKKNDIETFDAVVDDLNLLKIYFYRYKLEAKQKEIIIKNNSSSREINKINQIEEVLLSEIKLISKKIFNQIFVVLVAANQRITDVGKKSNTFMLLFIVFALIIIIFNMFTAIKAIVKPLASLENGAKRIKDGNYNNTIEFPGIKDQDDELSKVTIAFNEMSKKLNETFVELNEEISERKNISEQLEKSLGEKDVLLKEIHHRVKNNLQVISSLLSMQSNYIVNPKDRELFLESQNRVHSISVVHEMLYQSGDLKKINLNDFLITIIRELRSTYANSSASIDIKLNVDEIFLEVFSAIPCGLILTELVSNSFKHAFSQGDMGTIDIIITKGESSKIKIIYSDTGKGLPDGFDIKNISTLGFRLIRALTSQLDGQLQIVPDKSFKIIIDFEENN